MDAEPITITLDILEAEIAGLESRKAQVVAQAQQLAGAITFGRALAEAARQRAKAAEENLEGEDAAVVPEAPGAVQE